MPFRGHIATIDIGRDGLVGYAYTEELTPRTLVVANNVQYQGGGVSREGGSSKYNSVALDSGASILGGHDWWPTTSLQRMIVLNDNGTLFRDTGAGTFSTTLATGLTVSNKTVQFIDGGSEVPGNDKKLFIFTGQNQVRTLIADGTTATAEITSPPSDWSAIFPQTGTIHEGRLWGALGHTVYYSTASDHEDFTATGLTGNIAVYPGEGKEITRVESFKGLLICFKKPKGIYLIDTSSNTVADWRVARHSRDIGIAGLNAIAPVDDDLVFVGPAGKFHRLSAVTEFGNLGSVDLTDEKQIDEIVSDRVNLGAIDLANAIYYPSRSELHVALADTGSSANTLRLVMDFNDRRQVRWRLSDKDAAISMWLREDANSVPRLVTSDSSGFVWLLDQTTINKDSSGYISEFRTPELDFSHLDPALGAVAKNLKKIEVEYDPQGDFDLTVDVYTDGKIVDTLTFNMGGDAATLGSLVLGTDVLGTDTIRTTGRRAVGKGRFIALHGKMSTAGDKFSISRIRVFFMTGNERSVF